MDARRSRNSRNGRAVLPTGAREAAYPDPDILRALFDDPAAIRQLIKALAEITRADLQALESASRSGDAVAAERALHHILGGLRVLGSTPVLDRGRYCLEALRDGRMRADDAELTRLRCYLQVLLDGIQAQADRGVAGGADAAAARKTPGGQAAA